MKTTIKIRPPSNNTIIKRRLRPLASIAATVGDDDHLHHDDASNLAALSFATATATSPEISRA